MYPNCYNSRNRKLEPASALEARGIRIIILSTKGETKKDSSEEDGIWSESWKLDMISFKKEVQAKGEPGANT